MNFVLINLQIIVQNWHVTTHFNSNLFQLSNVDVVFEFWKPRFHVVHNSSVEDSLGIEMSEQ